MSKSTRLKVLFQHQGERTHFKVLVQNQNQAQKMNGTLSAPECHQFHGTLAAPNGELHQVSRQPSLSFKPAKSARYLVKDDYSSFLTNEEITK